MITFPHAKINLGLYITGKRADGFHNIESIFYPVPLYDALEFIPGSKSRLQIFNNDPGCTQEENLVWKAWKLLGGEKTTGPLDIALYKNIPFGAGLGGGSANCAFMLEMLNTHFSLGYSKDVLQEKAAILGSDCPFFLENKPCLATGKGEKLTPVEPFLQGYYWVIVVPEVKISTKEAYANIKPGAERPSLQTIPETHPGNWKNELSNDFETYAFQKHPGLEEIKQELYNSGALYAAMTGSGSCLYGIFESVRKSAEAEFDKMPYRIETGKFS